MTRFALFPEEQHFWSFQDYQAVLDVTRSLRPLRVVEFGPGSSTLALIEGGAQHIDTCEDQDDWLQVYCERLVDRFPDRVAIHKYLWADPLTIPCLDEQRWDLALIDGPFGTQARVPVIEWCLPRCTSVLIPTEDVAYGRSALRPKIAECAARHGRTVEWMETGPLSGGFALVM